MCFDAVVDSTQVRDGETTICVFEGGWAWGQRGKLSPNAVFFLLGKRDDNKILNVQNFFLLSRHLLSLRRLLSRSDLSWFNRSVTCTSLSIVLPTVGEPSPSFFSPALCACMRRGPLSQEYRVLSRSAGCRAANVGCYFAHLPVVKDSCVFVLYCPKDPAVITILRRSILLSP